MRFTLPVIGAALALSVGVSPAVAQQHQDNGAHHRHQHHKTHKRVKSHVALHVSKHSVLTGDGVPVARHENEIGGTTNVADHREFADRRTTKIIDGSSLTGWFTEDFTWSELATLRAIERLPAQRQHSTTFDGLYPILRLSDLRQVIVDAGLRLGRELVMVAEIKHATYFESIGLPLDELFAAEVADWATATNLVVECF